METPNRTLNQILRNAGHQFAEKVAVKGNGFKYSYQAFDALTDQFAESLLHSGIETGSFVGICLPRSAEMVIGIFGVLKAGCAYVPADPDYPDDRIRFVFEDAAITTVITVQPLVERFKELGYQTLVPVVAYDADRKYNPINLADPNSLAYVLFTSGSTGKPKGVMVEHHSVVNLIRSVQHDYPLDQGDVVLLKSPYTFDGSVWELYGWMEQGSTLYVAPPGFEKDPAALAKLIQSEKISFAFFVSSMLSSFLDYIDATGNKAMLASLKWVSAGGEVVSPVLVQRFYKVLQQFGTKLINVYGPTETTVYATTFLCEPNVNYAKIPVGLAVANDYIYIIGNEGQIMPLGDEGEICIGGEGVARGYLNRPELSAERFVPNPERPGEMMYRTGDIGKMLAGDLLDFIGRRDFQVKLRGLRIELGEIENALYSLGYFKEIAVLFTKDRSGDDGLIGCFVPHEPALKSATKDYELLDGATREMISNELLKTLPSFMLPTEYIVCKSFPVSENGKLDRKALPSVASLYTVDKEAFQPANAIEQVVYDTWKKVLSRERIHGDEEFFEAGGQSLKAIQVITAIISALGIELPLHIFYAGLTIPKMVKIIQEQQSSCNVHEISSSLHAPASSYPVTDSQAEMLILHSMDSTKIQHNILVEFDLHGSIDQYLLEKNLQILVNDEEMFRSTFDISDDGWRQFIHETVQIPFGYTDLSEDPQNELRFKALVLEFGQTILHPERLPLLGFKLVKLQNAHYKLLLVIHHIVFDGWSLQLFTLKLADVYRVGKVTDSVKAPIRMGDYAKWHIGFTKEIEQTQAQYWKQVFPDFPAVLRIPKKFKATRNKAGQHGKRYWFWISEQDSASVEKVCNEMKITPFSFFLGIYQLSLSAWSGQRDICVGTPFANRKHPDVANLIGYFTNMVAIRSKIDHNKSFIDFFQQISTNSIQAFSHADLSFGQVVKHLGVPQLAGVHPLFQAMFIMQNWPNVQHEFPGFTLDQKELGNQTCKADFSLNVEKTGQIYECWLEYDTELYDLKIIEQLTADILQLVTWVTQNPKGNLDLIPDFLEERARYRSSGTCVLLGDGNINLHCIDILQSYNFNVTYLVSSDLMLKQACAERGVVFQTDLEALADESFDYLFSINNGILLPKATLAKAKKMAINYHDSPLPRYAGMFASNHAIANGEDVHGVSWHKMVERIDGGEILESEQVPVYNTDTAWLLNTRCFEAAIKSFDRLALKLATGSVVAHPQDLSLRSFYPRLKRPQGLGLLRWNSSVQHVSALVRSTDFGGHYMNEFMLPHFKIQDTFYTIEKAEFFASTNYFPGELGFQNGKWFVGCQGGGIQLSEVYDALNNSLTFDQLIHNHQLKPGDKLPLLADEEVQQVGACYTNLCKNESWWKSQLAVAEYLPWPFCEPYEGSIDSLKIPLAKNLLESLPQDQAAFLKAALMLYLLQVSDTQTGTFGVVPEYLTVDLKGFTSLFASVLPLHIHAAESIALSEAVEHVNQQLQAVYAKGTYPCDLALRYPDLRDSANNQPSILFINKEEDLKLAPENAVCFMVSNAQIACYFLGNSKLDQNLADAFQESLQFFLHQAALNPETELKDLKLLDSKGFATTYSKLNPYAPTSSTDVISLFKSVSETFPGHIAVDSSSIQVTYAEFYLDIQKMAAVLNSQGVQKNSVVAISLDRGYDYYVAMMASLYLGAAFLPIDPSQPEPRKKFMLTDSKAAVLVAKTSELNVSNIHLVLSDVYKNGNPLEFQAVENFDGLAYIIYTSGSTGMPKGVKIGRKALASFVLAALQLYEVKPTERILQFANLGFDASIEEMFCAFCSGSTLFPRTEEMLLPNALVDFTQKNGINFWDLPTAYWRQVIQYLAAADLKLPDCLQTLIIGGEATNVADITLWDSLTHQTCILYNTYGPTETTVVALAHKLTKGMVLGSAVPIGKPLMGYQAFIVDRLNRLMPLGIAGELLVSGNALATGYLNNEAKEKEVFIPLELPGAESVRCYRTGDRVALNSQFSINYLGRRDNQVKIRGFRVELSEIEAVIKQLTETMQCIALYNGPQRFQNQLVAFVTVKIKNLDELKRQIGQILPAYMVPSNIVEIEAIPLTSNGKTDTKALWSFALANFHENQEAMEVPGNAVEEQMLEAWREVLGIESLGVTTDFFDAGGHSLKAVQLITKIQKVFQVNLPLASLITHPTVRQLSGLISSGPTTSLWQCLVPIRPEGSKTPLFLVHGAGLNVLLYQSLGRNLKPDRPIYALQAKGLDGKQQISTSIHEMASDYIAEIQQVQPHGPYLLFGFSLGGFIAYEMAKQLIDKGQEVRFMGVIDTVTYAAHEELPFFQFLVMQFKLFIVKPLFIFWMFLLEPWEAKGKYLLTKYGNLRHEVLYQLMKRGVIRTASLRKDQGMQDEPIPVFQKAQVAITIYNALKSYTLKPAPVLLDLFRAEKKAFYIPERKTYGWGRFASKGVNVHNIPGEHSLIFAPPNDKFFAAILDKRLDELESLD